MSKRSSSGDALVKQIGGRLNNMPPLNPPTTNWAGIDQLTMTYQIDWGESWGALRELLDKYQITAMNQRHSVDAPEFDGKVRCWGGKIADKQCRFGIERNDFIILISDDETYAGTWPNVKVEVSGERCLVYDGGADAAIRSAEHFLERLGAQIDRESVNRVDFCADLPELNIKRFVVDYLTERWTCRSKIHNPRFNPDGISLYFGTGALILRIYDKLGEMKSSALRGAPAKFEHMIQKRWHGKEPAFATRVEFQLRREWMRKNGIGGYNSLVQKSPAILEYLTGAADKRWFRFLTQKANHKHTEKNETSPRWRTVQETFLNQFYWKEEIVQIDPNKADVTTLLKQALGVIEAAASNRGYSIRGKKSTAPELYRFADYNHFEKWFCVMLREYGRNFDRWDITPESDRSAWDGLDGMEGEVNNRRIEL